MKSVLLAVLATGLIAPACGSTQEMTTASGNSMQVIANCEGESGGPKTTLFISLDVSRKSPAEDALVVNRLRVMGVYDDMTVSATRKVSRVEQVREADPMGDTGARNASVSYNFVVGGTDRIALTREEGSLKFGTAGIFLQPEMVQAVLTCKLENVAEVLNKIETVQR